MYNSLTSIVVATIALAFLVVPVDSAVKALNIFFAKSNILPDPVEDGLVFIALAGLASIICWQGGFDYYTRAFDFDWKQAWQGYVATGFTIAGGSAMLVKRFSVVSRIPSVISGVSSYMGWGGNTTTNKSEEAGSD